RHRARGERRGRDPDPNGERRRVRRSETARSEPRAGGRPERPHQHRARCGGLRSGVGDAIRREPLHRLASWPEPVLLIWTPTFETALENCDSWTTPRRWALLTFTIAKLRRKDCDSAQARVTALGVWSRGCVAVSTGLGHAQAFRNGVRRSQACVG